MNLSSKAHKSSTSIRDNGGPPDQKTPGNEIDQSDGNDGGGFSSPINPIDDSGDADSKYSAATLKNWGAAADDLVAMSEYKLDSGDDDLRAAFEAIFGGYSGEAVVDFISDRFKYVFALEDFTSATVSPSNVSVYYLVPDDEPEIFAANIGITYWLDGIYYSEVPSLKVGSTTVKFNSPTRNGVVQLGNYYGKEQYNSHILETKFSTLAHEARHSDCNVSESRMREHLGKYSSFNEMYAEVDKEIPKCGYFHVICDSSENPELEGYLGCDKVAYGAYYVDVVALKALRENASEETKALLDMELTWIQPLLQYDWQAHYRGERTPPITENRW